MQSASNMAVQRTTTAGFVLLNVDVLLTLIFNKSCRKSAVVAADFCVRFEYYKERIRCQKYC